MNQPATAMSAPVIDPTCGYTPEQLRRLGPPETEPADFDAFWRATRTASDAVPLRVSCIEEGAMATHRILRITYDVLGGHRVGGWLLEPLSGRPLLGLVVGHGYGGRDNWEEAWALPRTVAIFPCMPGFHRSASALAPNNADRHVVHGITHRDTYLLRACVAATWAAASVIAERHPHLASRQVYVGGSFGGGLGALAVPWEPRFLASALVVPTFGHHPIRLRHACCGSGESVRMWHRDHPEVVEVLGYYDAATAAKRITVPTVASPAFSDPAVHPPGQWAVANAITGAEIVELQTGHPNDGPGDAAWYRAAWRLIERTRDA